MASDHRFHAAAP